MKWGEVQKKKKEVLRDGDPGQKYQKKKCWNKNIKRKE